MDSWKLAVPKNSCRAVAKNLYRRDASYSVTGTGAFGTLKFESGTHRVQRVPETEAAGRVHTSTITVAVMP